MQTEKSEILFAREPRGNVYKALLQYACDNYPFFQLVVRPELEVNENGERVQEELSAFEISRTKEKEWPGTILFTEEFATVVRYNLNEQSSEILERTVQGLFDWQQPDCPEDLCILRSDGSPWLVSIAHEGYAHLEITEDEKVELFNLLGEVIERRVY